MRIPFIQRHITREQSNAREWLQLGIEAGEPTEWQIYKKPASLSRPEARRIFAAFLRAMANNPDMQPENPEARTARRNQMYERALALEQE